MNVLVTGGAGYIGSHTAEELIKAGHTVIVADDLSTGFREAVPQKAQFIHCDLTNLNQVTEVFKNHSINVVIQFAAKLNVKESTQEPLNYYQTNILGLINVLHSMKKSNVNKIVFSSTAAVYGEQIQNRAITENDPKLPLNAYGFSKLFCEQILADSEKAYGIKHCILRYFNVAGASDSGLNGQRTANAYHLIHLASQAAVGKISELKIFGTDYPTRDGTCLRDYIHVQDLADIHVLAAEYLQKQATSNQFNCGYGHGYSVKQVISEVQKYAPKQFKLSEAERRPGDASSLIADSAKLKQVLNWTPKRDDLSLICKSAIEWEKKC